MNMIQVWEQEVSTDHLSESDIIYLKNLPNTPPQIEWVWKEMDRIWDHYQLENNKPFIDQKIAEFYSHPVWVMNGFYTQKDQASNNHRKSIAEYLVKIKAKSIADFGGGFGVLAMLISSINQDAHVKIIEPYPSKLGLQRIEKNKNISVTKELNNSGYDAIIAQDVLEHVEDPILLAYEIASSLRKGGVAIFANCFYPVIKCHLPANFHLRYTFPYVMRAMGLKYSENIKGAEHAQVFEVDGELNLAAAKKAESLSRFCHPLLNNCKESISKIKHGILKS